MDYSKNIILLFIIAITAIKINAQTTLLRSSIPNFGKPCSLGMTKDSAWIISEGISNYSLYPRICILDKNGNMSKIKALDDDSGKIFTIAQLIQDSLGNIFILGIINGSCDVIDDHINLIYKFDKNLNELWKRSFTTKNSSFFNHGSLAFNRDHNLLFGFKSCTYLISPQTGNTIRKDSMRTDTFYNCFPLEDNNRLIINMHHIIRTDSLLHPLWIKVFPNTQAWRLKNNLFAFINKSKLFITDDTFKILANYTFGNNLNSGADIAILGNHIYFIGSNINQESVLYKFDMNLALIDTEVIPRLYFPGHIFTQGNIIGLAGQDKSDDNNLRSEIVIMDTTYQLKTLSNDIGIFKIIPTGITRTKNNFYTDFYISLDIVVKNYGNTMIHNFSAYTDGSFIGGFCSNGTNPIVTYSSLNLAPGDTQSFHLGSFLNEFINIPAQIKFNVCAYTSDPNTEVDKNPHNDYICDTFLYTGIEDAKENNLVQIKLFPNPVTQDLQLTSMNHLEAKIDIFNASGQIIQSNLSFKGEKLIINTTSLASGFYLLRIYNSTYISNMKFIKL